MIIIEGTDKSGKTTFIHNLITKFPQEMKNELSVCHFGILPDNWDYCDNYLSYIHENIILDRFIDSERAYGPVYRNKVNPLLTKQKMNKVYRQCAKHGALVVHCLPQENEVFKRIEKEGDLMIKKKEQLVSLREEFKKIFNNNYPLEIETIDTTNPLRNEIYENIINKSLVLERMCRRIRKLNYNGFITPSSKYIIYTYDYNIDQLHEFINEFTDIPIKNFAIINSRDICNNIVSVNNLIMEINYKMSPILLLGNKAAKDYFELNKQFKELNNFQSNTCENLKHLAYYLNEIKV